MDELQTLEKLTKSEIFLFYNYTIQQEIYNKIEKLKKEKAESEGKI